MADEKHPVIVSLDHKIPAENRDTFRAHVEEDDYILSIHNAEDESEEQLNRPAVYAVKLTEEGINAFRNASNVKAVEPDVEVSTAEFERHEDFSTQEIPANQSAALVPNGVQDDALEWCQIPALESGVFNGTNVDIHVLDTGILDEFLEYFEGAIFHKESAFGIEGAKDSDPGSHGTWCAGAAWAPGAELGIWQVLRPTDGSGPISGIVQKIYAAADLSQQRGRRGVISMSLGGSGLSQALDDAMGYAWLRNIISVAASGNHDPNTPNPGVGSPGNGYNAFCVGNYDHKANAIAPSSNQGPEIEVAAPGSKVRGLNGVKTGTSMATPIVARGAACLISSNADLGMVWNGMLAGGLNTGLPVEVEGRGGLFRAMRSAHAMGVG